jgi:hypothetical protein
LPADKAEAGISVSQSLQLCPLVFMTISVTFVPKSSLANIAVYFILPSCVQVNSESVSLVVLTVSVATFLLQSVQIAVAVQVE